MAGQGISGFGIKTQSEIYADPCGNQSCNQPEKHHKVSLNFPLLFSRAVSQNQNVISMSENLSEFE